MPRVRKEINDFCPFYDLIYLFADESANERYAAMFDDVLGFQGFDWKPGFITFITLGEWANFRLEVVILDVNEIFEMHPDAVRVIQLPFQVIASSIYITNCGRESEVFIELPNGDYAVFFEIMLDSSPEALNSPSYQDDISGGTVLSVLPYYFTSYK